MVLFTLTPSQEDENTQSTSRVQRKRPYDGLARLVQEETRDLVFSGGNPTRILIHQVIVDARHHGTVGRYPNYVSVPRMIRSVSYGQVDICVT